MDHNANYKCICSDLDRTLLRKDGTLSLKTKETLITLMNQGITFIPATGRSFYSLPEDIRRLSGIKYVIVSNGAAIYDMQREIPVYQNTLNSRVTEEVFLLLSGYSYAYEGFINGVPYTSFDYYNFPEKYGGAPDSSIYIQGTRKPVKDIRSFLLEHKDQLDALDVIVPPEIKDEVQNYLRKNLTDVYITSSVPHLIEISDEHAGKHQGICEAAKLLNIKPDQMIAFGDGDNDSDMLKQAGMGIAVSNASYTCKLAADWIIGHHDEDAVANFLSEFFLLSL